MISGIPVEEIVVIPVLSGELQQSDRASAKSAPIENVAGEILALDVEGKNNFTKFNNGSLEAALESEDAEMIVKLMEDPSGPKLCKNDFARVVLLLKKKEVRIY